MSMARTANLKRLFQHLRQVDGECLALRKAAELLEMTCAATDVGPASKPLCSDVLDGLLVPDKVVRDVADDLRAQARAIERRRDRWARAKFDFPIEADDASGEDEDELVTPISSKKYRIVTNQ